MRHTAFRGGKTGCPEGVGRSLAATLAGLVAMAFLFMSPAAAQDSKTNAVLPAPSSGKAIVCIYRTYRFTGSAAHDHLFINGVYWAYLKNSEYAYREVDPGPVVVSGTTAMYTVDVFTVAATAAHEATKKENERIHFDAEAGKTYFLKWTSEPMGTGVKVTMMDPGKGAKEMSKLHLSTPPDDKENAKPEAKDADKPPANH